MTQRFVCIHGHFYQPPRENPWLEDVELQDSAYPFHDWNDRITTECYQTNAAARILDQQNLIIDIANNYEKTSFNFGPTLLSWLEKHRPETYQAIIDSDLSSRARFGGHGAALAQAYNHMIMPLANLRDKRTQTRWGAHDFEARFGRKPEGMWLPETAVDVETLEILAEEGIAFTILAPHQAKAVRRLGDKEWQRLGDVAIDTRCAYRCNLPSGRSIALFFYNGAVSQEIAFSDLLENGEKFSHRMVGTFSERKHAELSHIATDGETYGHHHRYGEMALAYCLRDIEKHQLARITIYAEFLSLHPPSQEVQIFENSSWSCAHGVERWRADCGCRINPERNWQQKWRRPLRAALDWLRDRLALLFEREMRSFNSDPWTVRDTYIEVLLDRNEEHVKNFLQKTCARPLTAEEETRLLRLLEMQRHAMLMYTSCGWFFDEVSGIETVQILAYASRAIQLAEESCDAKLEAEFLEWLERVPSNIEKYRHGAQIYRLLVLPTRLDLRRVAAHHAIASEFEGNHRTHQIYSYEAHNLTYNQLRAGRILLATGHTRVRSHITWNQADFSFAVLHFGDHNLNAGVHEFKSKDAFTAMQRELQTAFERSNLAEVIRLMDRHFAPSTYSLLHLFKDEQRKVLNLILQKPLEEINQTYQAIYDNQFALLRFLRDIGAPAPQALVAPAECVVSARLHRLFSSPDVDPCALKAIVNEAERLTLALDDETLGFAAGRQISRQMDKLAHAPRNLAFLITINETLELLNQLPISLDLWRAQNGYYAICNQLCPSIQKSLLAGESGLTEWFEQFRKLGQALKVGMI
ncbi:Glycosyl hydrolase family 57 [Geoalkalibacter ferrihydriticus]|uniref:Glycoside hydrolase n=2 Tax=Geoalkalibacter ferrihydriticus TaxID=392333 RepID=A0A0C2HTD8_9BACT|nr:DUF3536 domain-containing protein [Geoalkalibacter ferrihydriticus]KIH78065.1 glycoside hydrolase [Geoalkalibacter ferrihydriticus DSM 17813]SDM30952.1 Glycosyl hydrolase family 57 [Geoalkalibacter ferrihydriticus]